MIMTKIPLLSKHGTAADQYPRKAATLEKSRRRDDSVSEIIPTILLDTAQQNESSDRIILGSNNESINAGGDETLMVIKNKELHSIGDEHGVFEYIGKISDGGKQGQAHTESILMHDDAKRTMSQTDATNDFNGSAAHSQIRSQIEGLPTRSVNVNQVAGNNRKNISQTAKLKTRHIKNLGTPGTVGDIKGQTNKGDHSGKF